MDFNYIDKSHLVFGYSYYDLAGFGNYFGKLFKNNWQN